MWCDRMANVALLGRWLTDQGLTALWCEDDYWYYLEKPWKWTTEWEDLQAELAESEVAV